MGRAADDEGARRRGMRYVYHLDGCPPRRRRESAQQLSSAQMRIGGVRAQTLGDERRTAYAPFGTKVRVIRSVRGMLLMAGRQGRNVMHVHHHCDGVSLTPTRPLHQLFRPEANLRVSSAPRQR